MSDAHAPTLVILAAGLGRRFGADKPFVAAGPHGEPLFAYAIHDAAQAGARDVVLVVREEQVAAARSVAESAARWLPVRLVVQRLDDDAGTADAAPFAAAMAAQKKPWGTGHAVLAARDAVDGTAIVINGDDFYGADAIAAAVDFARGLDRSRRVREQAAASGTPRGAFVPTGALIGYEAGETLSARGPVNRAAIETGPDGRLVRLHELAGVVRRTDGSIVGLGDQGPEDLAADALVSMNCWVLPHETFADLALAFAAYIAQGARGEFMLPMALTGLVHEGRLRLLVRRAKSGWFGLTHTADLADARDKLAALVAAEVYPAPLLA
jgi:dTDP-glucose pyrophosphorylase